MSNRKHKTTHDFSKMTFIDNPPEGTHIVGFAREFALAFGEELKAALKKKEEEAKQKSSPN